MIIGCSYERICGTPGAINDFGKTALSVANAKETLDFGTIFFKDMLCNILVDPAVILELAADSVEGKILGIFSLS